MSAAQAEPSKVLRVCHDDGDPIPDAMNGTKGTRVSPQKILAALTIELTARKTGIPIEMIGVPWKRCMVELQKGTVDGAFSASYVKERAEYAAYPMHNGRPDERKALQYDSYSLYRQRGTHVAMEKGNFIHLSGPIGVQPGHSVTEYIRSRGISVDDSARNAGDNLKKIAAGRLQVAALTTHKADHFLKNNPDLALQVEKLPTPLYEGPKFLIFSKRFAHDYPQTAEAVWSAIPVVRATPEFKAEEQRQMAR